VFGLLNKKPPKMFAEFMELLKQGDKLELLTRCYNRGFQAFDRIYAYEESKMGSFWRFDERYYEHGITMLYERSCYAMG
jgi:hypothetical protein